VITNPRHLTRPIVRLLAVLIALVAVGVHGSASAATYDEYNLTTRDDYPPGFCHQLVIIETSWGTGCYWEQEDHFDVWDKAGDGYSVAILWRMPESGRSGICRHTAGNDTAGYCNKDLPEGDRIYFYIGRCDQTTTRNCQSPSHYVNDSREDWVTA